MSKSKKELEAELKVLQQKLDAAGKKADPVNVKGSYEAKNGNTYGFKAGWAFTRHMTTGEKMASEDVLKDPEMMEWLIGRGYGGLEVIKEAEPTTEEE